jgi:glycosyltransferase involved in cell wall biosynthesis
MKIAIHAADIDHKRIDGTRVYLFNMLKNFGVLDQGNSFFIYHRNIFNPQLAPPDFRNYTIKKVSFPMLWTQIRFAFEVWRDKPDVLWMPVHNMPMFRRKNLRTVVTVHDLAFKIFPQYFTQKDLAKLNKLSDLAIKNADRIIAVSECTKKDILRFFPQISKEKIIVIHHGVDAGLFQKDISFSESEKILSAYDLKPKKYILYVGAIQPRKNLGVLISAFEEIKKSREDQKDLKLVIAGAPAWKSNGTLKKIADSEFKNDIVITGTLDFEKLPIFYRNAKMFVFPSLYEGFGIPVLEAMAAKIPVICAKNSSLVEAGGEAAVYFETESSQNLADCMEKIFANGEFEKELVQKGIEHVKNFSWEKSAQKTLDSLLKWK